MFCINSLQKFANLLLYSLQAKNDFLKDVESRVGGTESSVGVLVQITVFTLVYEQTGLSKQCRRGI